MIWLNLKYSFDSVEEVDYKKDEKVQNYKS